MASGFTALFGAPLGGSLFSLEILHHKHAVEYYKAIIPALVASCFSYLMFALIIHLGIGATWDLKAYHYTGVYDFAYATAFGIVGTLFGWIFIFVVKFFKKVFEYRKFPIYIKTCVGGIILGIIAFYFPLTRYFGHNEINQLINGNYALIF